MFGGYNVVLVIVIVVICCCYVSSNCGDLLVYRKAMVVWRLGWPNGGRWCDVVFGVDCVVIDVVCVVVCDGCDCENHGEALVMLFLVAGWSGDWGVLFLVV